MTVETQPFEDSYFPCKIIVIVHCRASFRGCNLNIKSRVLGVLMMARDSSWMVVSSADWKKISW